MNDNNLDSFCNFCKAAKQIVSAGRKTESEKITSQNTIRTVRMTGALSIQ